MEKKLRDSPSVSERFRSWCENVYQDWLEHDGKTTSSAVFIIPKDSRAELTIKDGEFVSYADSSLVDGKPGLDKDVLDLSLQLEDDPITHDDSKPFAVSALRYTLGKDAHIAAIGDKRVLRQRRMARIFTNNPFILERFIISET